MSNRSGHTKTATKMANSSNDKVGNKSTNNRGNKQTLLSNLVSTSLRNKAVVAGVNKSQQAKSSLTDASNESKTLTNPTLKNIDTTEKKSDIMTDETTEKTEINAVAVNETNIVNEPTEAVENTEATESTKATDEPEQAVEMRTVDVVVAGSTYPVNCPVGEKEELDKAVLYINHFIRDIRKSAPSLNHENILVLCCLNMYEEMKQHRNAQASIRHQDKKIQELLDRITEDAESILD